MEEELHVVNCKITGTRLGGMDDHGIFTFWITLEGKGWGQGLGGFALDACKDGRGGDYTRVGWGPGIIAIRSILETVGVNNWEELKGTLCRAKVGGPGSSRTPIIGHIIDDKWFDLSTFATDNKKS